MEKRLFGCFALLGITAAWSSPAETNARLLRQPTVSQSALAFIYSGDLWAAPRTGGPAKRLTKTPDTESSPRFSPDGSQIAFTRSGDVYVMPASGGVERRLTWHPAADAALGWTSDGSKLLIRSSRSRGSITCHPQLLTVPPEGGWPESLAIPRATFGSFAADGRRLAYSPTPEMVVFTPWKRHRGGAMGRIAIYDLENNSYEELPRADANDLFPMWHGEAIYFASDRDRIMNLYRYDVPRKETARLTAYKEWDVKNPSLGPDAVVYENGGWIYEMSLPDHRSKQIHITLPREALPKDEDRSRWLQALEEAWSTYAARAFSPAPNWGAIKPRYVELMKWAAESSDAEYVLKEMLGEAGQSHITLERKQVSLAGGQTGLLGADFDAKDGLYRVSRIYTGSPADEKRRGPLAAAGVREGDYLLAVNGESVRTGRDLAAAFVGLAGKDVTLTISSRPSGEGARRVTVRPVADERALRYAASVQDNVARITERTEGRVGYVHVANVDASGVEAFRRDWRALRGKVQAIIIDIRNNTGGTQPQDVWDWIARKPVKLMYDRKGRVPPSVGPYLDGPKVMITNDQSVSGGDELAFFFKREKLGPLVGTTTMGGMIGQGGQFPVAGGWTLGLPQLGFYWLSPDGWAPENRGVKPDYVVELRPWPVSGGRDPQLEKAIELALDELRKHRPAIPVPPSYQPAR